MNVTLAIEAGEALPKPALPPADYSRFTVRLPRSLHRRLVQKAKTEGVSLNQMIDVALMEGHLQGIEG